MTDTTTAAVERLIAKMLGPGGFTVDQVSLTLRALAAERDRLAAELASRPDPVAVARAAIREAGKQIVHLATEFNDEEETDEFAEAWSIFGGKALALLAALDPAQIVASVEGRG